MYKKARAANERFADMAVIDKKTIPEKTKNFKINTRIIIASVLGIIIPILILSMAAGIFVITSKDKYDISSVNTDGYDVLNQIQWSQTISGISSELTSDSSSDDKYDAITETAEELEQFGTLIYIEKDGEAFYAAQSPEYIFECANRITPVNKNENAYYYGETGIVIISHTQSENGNYLILAVNGNYEAADEEEPSTSRSIITKLTGNAAAVLAVCVMTFVIAIIIISLIISKTIVDPIEKITVGADEIAKGNLDYEIDYRSTNELGQLAESFSYMQSRVKESIEQLNRADQQEKEMIAGIAHDLRTPLTSIKGYLEGIQDGVADTPEKQKHYLETIYDSAVSMEKMLNDLLTISKLELGSITLNCEDVRIADFVAYASEIGSELEKEGFEFVIKDKSKSNALLRIDTDRFTRVIDNIISNSIKYRRKGVKGKVSLIISEYEHSVMFEIADNGMGVDSASLTRIFDTLYRADKARSNVSDGSGLGLAVCRQIVELHGGMIWAQTNAAKGLSIFISLPKKEKEEKEDTNEKDSDH